jgi:hypothetical protein
VTPQGAKAGTADTWTASPDGGAPVESSCAISGTSTPATGFNIDVGISDVYASSCLQTVSTGFQEFDGPIQSYAVVVNANSASAGASISAEAAHIVFKDIVTGTTQTYPVSPWLDPTHIWIREGLAAGGAGVRMIIGLAFNPPFLPANDASNWSSAIPAANVITSGATLATDLGGDTASPGVNESLGIEASAVADPLRSSISELAFQGAGQTCGYYPDSNQKTSYDKINVREGRYQIWGPEHIVTAVASPGDGGPPVPVSISNPNNATADAAVQAFVNAFTQGAAGLGTLTEAENKQIIATTAQTSFVPQCAMRVRHSTGVDIGPEQSYLPPDSCGCYWDSIADSTSTPAGCTACPTGTECASLTATPTCRYGFCEAD